MKKILSLALALLLCFSAVSSASAASVEEWDRYWSGEESQHGVIMFAGSDETERNFSWYSAKESTPTVEITVSGGETKIFSGYCVKTYSGDYANKVTATGLEAGKEYSYVCKSEGYTSDAYTFKTEDDKSFSAIYVTDVHVSVDENDEASLKNCSLNFNNVIEDAMEKNGGISLLLSAGDQASLGLECEYKAYSASPSLRTISTATAFGNHDRKAVDYKTFKNYPNEKTNNLVGEYNAMDYWFVKGDVLFMVMNSNNGSGIDHHNFVKEAVKANPDVKWRIMMFHHDLQGGRIESRESENKFLRLIWGPICDEFKIDLVLLGHSHYYTVSAPVYGGEKVGSIAPNATVTDPAGTVYMVSGSINRPRELKDGEIPPLGSNIAIDKLTSEKIYNIIDFSEDSITVKSYTLESGEMFNSYTIAKTSRDGGHPSKLAPFYQPIVRFLGTVFAFFNNFSTYNRVKDNGINANLGEFIFAH